MATRPSPRVPGRDRQILQAAAELFFERGFHRVGVVEIGAKIGISGPAIYRHFSSKDEILAQLFNEALDHLAGPIEAHDDPHAELRVLVERHVDLALNRRELVSIFTHEERSLAEPLRKRFRKRMRAHAQHWEDVLARCYPDADERDVAAAVQGAIGLTLSVALWPQSALRSPNLPELLAGQVLSGVGSLGAAK